MIWHALGADASNSLEVNEGMDWHPTVAREQRGEHWAVIDYVTPRRAGEAVTRRPVSAERPQSSAPGRVSRPVTGASRLGMVVPSWERPCGIAEYTRSLIDGLQQLGHKAHILPGDVGHLPSLAANRNLKVVHFQYEYNLYEPARLRVVLNAMMRSGIHLVATVHSFVDAPDHNNLLKEFFGRLIVHADGIARGLEGVGVPAGRIQVCPMGIRLYPLPERSAVRAELDLGDEVALGFFGFIYPQKGIDQLALAVRELREEYPGLRCFLFANVAPNPTSQTTYERLRAFLDNHQLWEGITLRTGYLPEADVVKLLHAMDVNILPYQDYPARQVSAAVRTVMAAQRPVVTTDTFPFSDLRDEVYKVADPSARGIVEGVREVLGNQALQSSLMQNIRRYAEENSWARNAARHLALYDAVSRRYHTVSPYGRAVRGDMV